MKQESQEYEIIWITNESELNENEDLVEEFFTLYELIYSDSIEREAPKLIKDRVKSLNNSEYAYLYNVIDKKTKKLIAGSIIEFYFDSESVAYCIVTYLFVKEDYRRKKIGENLFKSDKGIKGIIKNLEKIHSLNIKKNLSLEIRAIFFETKYNEINQNKYIEHTSLLKKLKGKIIHFEKTNIEYYKKQAYIEPISEKNDHFLGVMFPNDNISDKLDLNDIYIFLKKYYETNNSSLLNSSFFESTAYFSTKEEILKKETPKLRNYLREPPAKTSPKLKFERVSVTFHFIQEISDEIEEIIKGQIDYKNVYCNTFNSFEKDLFSQNYVKKPQYYSKQISSTTALITFENSFDFNSEGRKETFIIDSEKPFEQRIKIFINHTYISDKKAIVWEVVFSPNEGNYFSEFEVIQLIKLYAGRQEGYYPNLSINYNQKDYDIYDFFHELTKDWEQKIENNEKKGISNKVKSFFRNKKKENKDINQNKDEKIISGTIQLDTKFASYRDSTKGSYKPFEIKRKDEDKENWYLTDIFEFFNAGFEAKDKEFEKMYDNKDFEDLKYLLNSFCGIALGIFDFERMSYEEVTDTLVPLSTSNTYFQILNKNNITNFCLENNIYESGLTQGIGINPYLIIPNSVITYNNYIVDKANIDSRSGEIKDSNDLNFLSKSVEILYNYLANEIPNVYQYETERKLYEEGMSQRGINDRKKELEGLRQIAKSRIESTLLERNAIFTILGILIGIISLTQVYDFSIKILTYYSICPPEIIAIQITFGLALIMILLYSYFYFSTRKYKKIIDKK